jgi:hypothetical protein
MRPTSNISSTAGYPEIRLHPDPASPKRRTPRRSPEEIRLAIERFLAASKQPTLVEPGEPPFDIRPQQLTAEARGNCLLLTVWDEHRSFARRVTNVEIDHRARLQLTVEKFGKKEGHVLLADLAAQRNASLPRRGERMIHREQFRRALNRQFPGWRISELTSEPGLAHTLSPTYPRAWLRKGTSQAIAAIAASSAETADGVLTFGLIWLDYIRKRETRITTFTLAVFLPEGTETDTALRLRYLDPSRLSCELYVFTNDGYEERVDPADFCNLDTKVNPLQPRDLDAGGPANQLEQAIRALDGVEAVELHDRSISFRVRGLEIARRTSEDEILFGIETHKIAATSHVAEIRELVNTTSQLRSAENHGSILFRRNPERWLESQVRARLDILDSSLCPEPIYGQVPAMAGARPMQSPSIVADGSNAALSAKKGEGIEAATYRADRDVIDLLAISRSGRLAVVELKATEDIHLPMQGLDYWIRVKWHLECGDFSGHFPGMTVSRQPPRLLLVCPALDLHAANEIVIQYFAPTVELEQIGVSVEWRKELRVMFRRTRS